MKRIGSIISVSFLLVLLLAANGYSTAFSWEFTGTINGVEQPLDSISVGDNFTGYFSYSYETIPDKIPQAPGTYCPDDNLSIRYSVNFDGFSTSGSALFMTMEGDSFPSTPEVVWGLNGFQGNPELNYIEDLMLTQDGLIILTEMEPGILFHIRGQFDTFEPTVQPVPEPATIILFGAGIAGFVGLRRKSGEKRG